MFTAELILFVVWASLLCEFIDSSLGGGYGTILTPLFLLFAIPKTLIVIAILISETITGITGPICHHGLGNTKFNRSEEGIENFKVLILIGGLGTIAVIISVYTAAILDTMGALGKNIFNIYIGILVTFVGILMLLRHKFNFSWKKMGLVGSIASFNKALSGGGFGPLVTAGQVISGRGIKSSIASALTSETPICFVGILSYLFLEPSLFNYNLLLLTLGLVLGSIPGSILGALGTRIIGKNERKLKYITAILVIVLGSYTLLKVINVIFN